MPMVLYKFDVGAGGKISSNGADCNGTFTVRGTIDPFYMTINATKMYPDHVIFLWGRAQTSKITDEIDLTVLDQFNGEWGFENGTKEGEFVIEK